MRQMINEELRPDALLDCSEFNQVKRLAKKLNVKPEQVKTAVRACCSNQVGKIVYYLKNDYVRH